MKKHWSYMSYMTYAFVLLFWIPAFAGMTDSGQAGMTTKGMPCYSKSVHFQSVPHDKESIIILEARRVEKMSINSDTFTYNLGREIIAIKSDSFASRKFLSDVKKGRCSAGETVKLIPERKSPFNTKFKAVRPH